MLEFRSFYLLFVFASLRFYWNSKNPPKNPPINLKSPDGTNIQKITFVGDDRFWM